MSASYRAAGAPEARSVHRARHAQPTEGTRPRATCRERSSRRARGTDCGGRRVRVEDVGSGMVWETVIEEWNRNVTVEAVREAVQLASQVLAKHADEFVPATDAVVAEDRVRRRRDRQYGRETVTPGNTRKCLSLSVTNRAEEQKAAAPIKQSKYPMPLLSRRRRCQRSASCD